MTKRMKILMLTCLNVLICINIVLAWNDDITHRDIAEYAAEKSIIGQTSCNYLVSLGLSKGIDEYLTWGMTAKKIRDWLRVGGMYEDTGFRSLNHFHNPLMIWKTAGLTDLVTGQSALLWAQS